MRALVDAGTVGRIVGGSAHFMGHDPNHVGGAVRWSAQDGDWQTVKGERRPYTTNSRGIGLLDMAAGIAEDRPHRCNEKFALHVLEVMDKSLASGASKGKWLKLTTTCERPAPALRLKRQSGSRPLRVEWSLP